MEHKHSNFLLCQFCTLRLNQKYICEADNLSFVYFKYTPPFPQWEKWLTLVFLTSILHSQQPWEVGLAKNVRLAQGHPASLHDSVKIWTYIFQILSTCEKRGL